ncbi:MAG TPA: thioredoxin domain-containing protein, partial [Blastocatellia bacterium]|nr:thioredoxin domain-containing protein [Blastocatellia bacterium]
MQQPAKFTNKLIDETSPYLLQHAHNPVDWYRWGDAAFDKAKAEDKPVLISIGYSACHWCHVMAHESFEDETAAGLMNENFINIKVDMEERPDVDQIYMKFVQMTTGRGGWPMNVFVTPDKLPFFGGTYFPPYPNHGSPSWRQILTSVADAWDGRREQLLQSAVDILGELRRTGIGDSPVTSISEALSERAYHSFLNSFDAKNGGFGGAPKFPAAMAMEFLLRYHVRTGDDKALEVVETTARKMANGGIYDHIGGGFHRYSVDAVWLVPHFEKMLYDNAQLIPVYLHLFQLTGETACRNTAVETLEYVRREMLSPDGGFYSTQDADSEGVEGKFFVWTPAEIEAVLGSDEARVFNFFYDVSDSGNFEGKNILNARMARADVSDAMKISLDQLDAILDRGRPLLFAEREKRIKPFRDEKIITAWNGLMLSAFAEAGYILGNLDYVDIARRNADFLLSSLRDDEGLLRTWKDGQAKLNGYIEDYANLADALITLFKVSGEPTYLDEAKWLADKMITDFWDTENGGFYFTGNNHEGLILRNKDFFDNAAPSGNSVAADVMLKLARLFDDEKYERLAVTV